MCVRYMSLASSLALYIAMFTAFIHYLELLMYARYRSLCCNAFNLVGILAASIHILKYSAVILLLPITTANTVALVLTITWQSSHF